MGISVVSGCNSVYIHYFCCFFFVHFMAKQTHTSHITHSYIHRLVNTEGGLSNVKVTAKSALQSHCFLTQFQYKCIGDVS